MPLATANDITEDTDWSDSGSISGEHVVESGNTLTISGEYTVEDNTNITIEEGATMIVTGSAMANAPLYLKMSSTGQGPYNSNFSVPINEASTTGTMKIYFAQEINFDIPISVNGENATTFNGTEFVYTGSFDVENIDVKIYHYGYETIALEEILLSPDEGTPSILDPLTLNSTNTTTWINYEDHYWHLNVMGDLEITGGEMLGAIISCEGTCALDSAELTYSGPIDVTGSISVTDSTLNGSRTDEDIIVWDAATVTWDNSEGTGGDTDEWVRILTSRTVAVPNGAVYAKPTNIGYDDQAVGILTDCSFVIQALCGDNIIDLATNEQGRMVEWQDSDSIIHVDDASATFHLDTVWGNYVTTIDPLPNENHFVINLDDLKLPIIEIVSIEASDDEATTNSRLGMIVTVENSGLSDATIFLECTSGGEDANIGSTVSNTIPASDSVEIALNWDTATTGTKTLDCGIFVPPEFEGISVGTNETVSSGEVVWSDAEDVGVNLIWPIVIGLGIGGVIYFVATTKKEMVETTVVAVDDEEDTGTIE